MKRLAWLMALAAVLSISMTAFAGDNFVLPADYTGWESDTASVNGSGYSTVLITKASDSAELAIIYADQNAKGLYDDAVSFLVKSDPDPGKYNVKLGSESGDTYETYFYVGVDSPNQNDKPMARLRNDEGSDERKIGYFTTVSGNEYDGYTAIKVCYKDGNDLIFGGFPINEWDKTVYSGSGKLTLVFQLNDVPAAWSDSISVYLTKDVLTETEGTSTVPGGGI